MKLGLSLRTNQERASFFSPQRCCNQSINVSYQTPNNNNKSETQLTLFPHSRTILAGSLWDPCGIPWHLVNGVAGCFQPSDGLIEPLLPSLLTESFRIVSGLDWGSSSTPLPVIGSIINGSWCFWGSFYGLYGPCGDWAASLSGSFETETLIGRSVSSERSLCSKLASDWTADLSVANGG